MPSVELKGAVIADTVRNEGKVVAQDVTINLPEVSFMTAEHKAMGNMTLPIRGMLESMEATIAKIGVDKGLSQLVRIGSKILEIRWIQDVIGANGDSSPEGCKAFLRVTPMKLPGISLEVGSSSENELSFVVTRYQLIAAGNELWCIDRLNGILRIDGKDYYGAIENLL